MELRECHYRPGDYDGPAENEHPEATAALGVPVLLTHGPGPTLYAVWLVEQGDADVLSALAIEPGTVVGASKGINFNVVDPAVLERDGREAHMRDWSDALRAHGREIEAALAASGVDLF